MEKYYFTFGQDHRHEYNGIVLDHNIVVEIKAENYGVARCKMFDICGDKWACQYTEETINMSYYPRGTITISPEPIIKSEK